MVMEMKVAKVLGSVLLVILVFSIVILAGCKSKAPMETSAAPSSEEQELNDGLNELDDLNQIDQEMNDVTLEELDNVDLE
jgi:outer membrane murein-binding lipoprotein Lpp